MAVIKHPHLVLRDASISFRREKTIGAFLSCLNIGIEFDVGEKDLPALWHELKTDIDLFSQQGSTPVDELLIWLSRHVFLPEDEIRWSCFAGKTDEEYERELRKLREKPSRLEDVSTPAQEIAKALLGEVEENRKERENDETRILDMENPYSQFRPAWEIEELLQQYFPRDKSSDPGAVIGNYLRLFFPRVTPPEPKIHWYSDDDLTPVSRSWMQGLIAEVCETMGCRLMNCLGSRRNDSAGDIASGLRLMVRSLRTLAANRGISGINEREAKENLRDICRSPQALLSALCRIQYWEAYEKHAHLVMQVLSSMPWGADRIEPDSIWAGAQEVFHNEYDFSRIAAVPWAVARSIVKDSSIVYIFEENGPTDDGVKRFLRTWLKATRGTGNGRSPIDVEGLPLHGLKFHSYFSPMETESSPSLRELSSGNWQSADRGWRKIVSDFDADLWFLLGIAESEDFNYLSLSKYYSEGSTDFALRVFIERRAPYYLEIVEAAHKAGFAELANAFLSFGVFSQAVAGHSIAGWPKKRLADLLHIAESTPGGEMVRRAISIAASAEANERYAIHQKWLRSVSRDSISLQVLPRQVGASRKDIELALSKVHIGEETWLWLCPETKNLLVNSEVMYSTCHLAMGPGGIDNFAQLAIGYCNTIESELLFRFRKVFESSEYDDHRRKHKISGKPTLGTAVWLIENFSRGDVSGELRSRISCLGVRAHEDPELVAWLRSCKNIRNKAAHPSTFESSWFALVREQSIKILPRLRSSIT